jgi:hypothetical protein
MFADLWQDLRYGIRTLRKNPLFATLAILTLTLGIGASTAMFSVLNAVLIAPLPFAEPERLVEIAGTNRDAGWEQNSLSHANFWDLPDLARDFSHIGGATFTNLNLTGREAPERLVAAQVSVGFLRALGVRPRRGAGCLLPARIARATIPPSSSCLTASGRRTSALLRE